MIDRAEAIAYLVRLEEFVGYAAACYAVPGENRRDNPHNVAVRYRDVRSNLTVVLRDLLSLPSPPERKELK